MKVINVKPQKLGWSLFRLIFLVGVSYAIVFPLLTKISSSFMSLGDLYDHTVLWIPRNFTLENFRSAFKYLDYPSAFTKSLLLTLVVSVLQLATCTIVGYGFARFKAKGKSIIFAFVLLTLIVPPQTITIPLYLNFRFFDLFGLLPGSGLNLIGTYWPVILMAVTGVGYKNGLFIYIMRQFFAQMPKELEEAASVDGASTFRTFWNIMLPSATPALVIVFLFAFVWQWNDYFYTVTFMRGTGLLTNNLNTLAINVLRSMGLNEEYLSSEIASLINNTGSLMFIAPLLLLYTFLQRYFIESVERSGLVG